MDRIARPAKVTSAQEVYASYGENYEVIGVDDFAKGDFSQALAGQNRSYLLRGLFIHTLNRCGRNYPYSGTNLFENHFRCGSPWGKSITHTKDILLLTIYIRWQSKEVWTFYAKLRSVASRSSHTLAVSSLSHSLGQLKENTPTSVNNIFSSYHVLCSRVIITLVWTSISREKALDGKVSTFNGWCFLLLHLQPERTFIHLCHGENLGWTGSLGFRWKAPPRWSYDW